MDDFNDQCYSQLSSIKGNRSVDFLDYLYNFNCSSPESYLIPDIPHDTEKCIQAENIGELIISVHTPTHVSALHITQCGIYSVPLVDFESHDSSSHSCEY